MGTKFLSLKPDVRKLGLGTDPRISPHYLQIPNILSGTCHTGRYRFNIESIFHILDFEILKLYKLFPGEISAKSEKNYLFLLNWTV